MQKVAQTYFTVADYREYLDCAMDEVSKLPHQENGERVEALCEVAIRTPLPSLIAEEPHANIITASAKIAKIGLTQHKYKALYPLFALVVAALYHYASYKSQSAQNYTVSFKGRPLLRFNTPWAITWLIHVINMYSEMFIKPKMLIEERARENVPLVHYEAPSEEDPFLIQLANRIKYDELLYLDEIPEELYSDTFLSQMICPISKKPIRYPVKVAAKGVIYYCDRLHLIKYISAMCNWVDRSSQIVPGLNCPAKEVVVLSRTNKTRLDYINWRLHEISQVLAKIQGVSVKDSHKTSIETVLNLFYDKFSWNSSIFKRLELYDKIDERFEKGVNLACDNSKSLTDRVIACVSSIFTFPALFTSIAALNVEVKLLSLGQIIFGGHSRASKLIKMYPDMILGPHQIAHNK